MSYKYVRTNIFQKVYDERFQNIAEMPIVNYVDFQNLIRNSFLAKQRSNRDSGPCNACSKWPSVHSVEMLK